jgi:hypothetical protein
MFKLLVLPEESLIKLEKQLVGLARGINSFAKFLKEQRAGRHQIGEISAPYMLANEDGLLEGELFSDQDLALLADNAK